MTLPQCLLRRWRPSFLCLSQGTCHRLWGQLKYSLVTPVSSSTSSLHFSENLIISMLWKFMNKVPLLSINFVCVVRDWRDGSEHVLLSGRSWVQFLAPIPGSKAPFLIVAPRHLTPSSGFFGNCTHRFTLTHRWPIIKEINLMCGFACECTLVGVHVYLCLLLETTYIDCKMLYSNM